MPDGIARPPALETHDGRHAPIDAAGDVLRFAGAFPAMTIPDGPRRGQPLSWVHYKVGIRTLNQDMARQKLATYAAVGITKGTPAEQDRWTEGQNRQAGY